MTKETSLTLLSTILTMTIAHRPHQGDEVRLLLIARVRETRVVRPVPRSPSPVQLLVVQAVTLAQTTSRCHTLTTSPFHREWLQQGLIECLNPIDLATRPMMTLLSWLNG